MLEKRGSVFSLAALDTKLLLDIFYTAKKVVKFKLSFLTQTRDVLTHVSKILPCFGLKSLEFLMECRKLLLRYHTIKDGSRDRLRAVQARARNRRSKEQFATLQKLTERYCILYRTLSNPPQVSVSYTT